MMQVYIKEATVAALANMQRWERDVQAMEKSLPRVMQRGGASVCISFAFGFGVGMCACG